MSYVMEKMAALGYKITPQRRIILDILHRSNKHLTADEITERVKAIEPSVSLATVYRNLSMLVDIQIVSKLDLHEGPTRYEINAGHNHHLVCLNCGDAVKLGVCPIEDRIQNIIDDCGFQVNSHHFEITGLCKQCQY
ncbi:hypothetical protein SYNTR_0110 [Candidatus Syntrophocurvum alkaliphilum]|uniref:Transcriptional repressor n=1 Tax=Candidatus Syntrophocurvum alkaliphilum TaxID=2293317 RepID=A0A6I6D5W1_9FIRM|nr:transcriptional repressor [Candidatus Syntrophocurvum alkaliphilum]QGT98703.1 hypothetical protein SYNTR_0110 [Candidatus Syntrophocurvum alkaliphilum]